MTGARWRKVRADLLSNRLRSGLAVVSLAVGTTAVGAMFLAATTVDASFATSFAAANPPSAMLITEPFGPELVDAVAAHPAVGQAEARRLSQLQISGPVGAPVTVELVAMPDFDDNRVGRIDPKTGTWPPAPGAIVLERASVAELGADVGDAVTVHSPGQAPRELVVRGTALDAYEVAPMLGGLSRGYVAMDTMTELTGTDVLNAVYLRSADQPDSRTQALAMTASVRDEVLDPAGIAVEASAVDDPGVHRADDALSFLTLAMQLLSLLALVIAVTLVVNTVVAVLSQQRTQIGVMKAVGATTRQLTAQYLAYVALLSAAAVVVSVPTSLLLGQLVAGFVAGLANIDLAPIGVPVAALLLQIAVATVLPVAAVVFAVRRATRTTVRDAITDPGLTGSTRAPRVRLPVSRPTMLAFRNAVRDRTRLALTVLTVALCGAVLVGVVSTSGGLSDLSDQVAGYSDYDVEVSLTEPTPLPRADEVLRRDPAVASVEGWMRSQGLRTRPDGSDSDAIDLTGVPPGSRAIAPTLLDGRWFNRDDDHAIVINTHLADAEPDLQVGDQMTLEIQGHRQQWHIVGISTTTLVGPVAYTRADDLAQVTGQPGTSNLLAVQLPDTADPADSAERLGLLARDAGLPVAQVQTNGEIREATDGLFDIATALLFLVGAVLAVVAVLGVAGTMTMGVVEQTREIGVLRTLGATTWAVRRHLLLQGLAIASTGAVLGAVLSVPVYLLLGTAIQTTLISADFPTSFSWAGVGIWTAIALAIGALGTTQPARTASHLTIRDTLAYE